MASIPPSLSSSVRESRGNGKIAEELVDRPSEMAYLVFTSLDSASTHPGPQRSSKLCDGSSPWASERRQGAESGA